MIRRISVDHRRSVKRGGDALHIPLDEVLLEVDACGIAVVALDSALQSVVQIDGRKSRLVELRYFGGLSLEETAEVLRDSPETAKRDCKMARAWQYPSSPASSNLQRFKPQEVRFRQRVILSRHPANSGPISNRIGALP
jgi:hypothetical protein